MEVVEGQEVDVVVVRSTGRFANVTETWSEIVRAPVMTILGAAAIPPGAASGTTSTTLTAAATRTIWVAQFRSHVRVMGSASRGSRNDRHPATTRETGANAQVNAPCPIAVRPRSEVSRQGGAMLPRR